MQSVRKMLKSLRKYNSFCYVQNKSIILPYKESIIYINNLKHLEQIKHTFALNIKDFLETIKNYEDDGFFIEKDYILYFKDKFGYDIVSKKQINKQYIKSAGILKSYININYLKTIFNRTKEMKDSKQYSKNLYYDYKSRSIIRCNEESYWAIKNSKLKALTQNVVFPEFVINIFKAFNRSNLKINLLPNAFLFASDNYDVIIMLNKAYSNFDLSLLSLEILKSHCDMQLAINYAFIKKYAYCKNLIMVAKKENLYLYNEQKELLNSIKLPKESKTISFIAYVNTKTFKQLFEKSNNLQLHIDVDHNKIARKFFITFFSNVRAIFCKTIDKDKLSLLYA